MKFLLISSNSSPRGGGEKYLVFMTIGLKRNGCDVDILLSNADYMDGWAKELSEAGAAVFRLPLKGLRDRKLRFVQSILAKKQQRRIAAFCRSNSPDYILVNQQYDEDSLDYIRGAELAAVAPVAAILHLPMTRAKAQRPFGRLRGLLLKIWYRKFAPLILFSSVDSQQEFLNYYKLNLPSEVLLSGVPLKLDLPSKALLRQRLSDPWINALPSSPEAIPIIGVACQFVPQKNLFTLIEAWKFCILKERFLCRLLLIGDGPLRPEIEGKLAEMPCEYYHITGWGEKYADYLHYLDLFVMPSCFESIPLALVEAVGNGTPALIARFNGSTELCAAAKYVSLWDGAENDAEDLAHAIMAKLRKLVDDRRIGLQSRADFCRFFSPEEMAKRLVTIFFAQKNKI